MKNSFQLTGLALLVSSIVLSGCAAKKAWSPELEQAREAYAKAASDPIVASLASAELAQAQQQLIAAETAADYFKSRPVIAHKATLSLLKSLEAEQSARSLQAKEDLRVAQADAPIPQVLPDTMRAGTSYSNVPTMAAATPAHDSTSGRSSAALEDLSLQIAALRQQINEIQNQGSYAQGSRPQSYSTDYTISQLGPDSTQEIVSFDEQSTGHRVGRIIDLNNEEDLVLLEEVSAGPELGLASANEPVMDLSIQSGIQPGEPQLGAARPVPDSDNSIQPAYAEAPAAPSGNAASDASLLAELRTMNARPSSNGGMSLTLGERYFESGTARLWSGRAARHLDNIAAVMVDNHDLVIDVEAHTDNDGTEEHRDKLTNDQSIAIKAALVMRGVDGSRVNTTGFGSSVPVADNNTALGKSQNRRVEIIFPNIIEK